MQKLITTKDVLDKLGINMRTQAEWRKMGCPFYEINSRKYYKQEELMEWVEKHKKGKL